MAVTILRPTNREEWLAIRKTGIGSSEVASILGINPYQTPYQLWRRKMEMDPPQEENRLMRMGHLLEDAVSTLWSEETGREVIKASAIDWIASSTEKPHRKASPDRTFWIPGMAKNIHNKGILECKTTEMPVDEEDLPKTWFCQVQWLLGVSETEQGSLAWLGPRKTFGYKDMVLVPEFYEWMGEEVDKFWTDNIVGGKEPEAIAASDVLTKYAKHTDAKIIEVGQEVLEAYTQLKQVKEELAALEEKKESLEDKIKIAFGDAEMIVYAGTTLGSWKSAKDSVKIDTKALAKKYPEIAKEFEYTTPGSRRFLLK